MIVSVTVPGTRGEMPAGGAARELVVESVAAAASAARRAEYRCLRMAEITAL
jgi:hypothetical protein